MSTPRLFSPVDRETQLKLKSALQDEDNPKKLENLAAALLSRLLDVPIFVAKSGFQHGGDAGPAGQQGRRFRIETKKYSDNTRLDDRELLGEIDHALARDEALEAWTLVATRSVSEQLAKDLIGKGERLGVPVVILGWTDDSLAPFAALCAYYPDLVDSLYSAKAGACARALAAISPPIVELVRRDLQSWSLGFASLRRDSHDRLDAIWASPRTSNAELGQNAAGGAIRHKIQRRAVHSALNAWWGAPGQLDAPAAALGWDGVGKTWAVLNWLVERKDGQPIVLVVPSSAAAGLTAASETAVKRFLADRLHALTGVRDHEHWLRRLDLLLKRPADEGVVLTLFFDGLNQEPSVPWLQLLKVFQAEVFSGRIRVIVSSRNHYFNEKLARLRGLVVPAIQIPVETYDTSPGGELDQMLSFEGISRDELHPDLVELARTPRLFKLVVKFRDRLVEAGQVTVHRLLWEYGRDTFGERAGHSFSEQDWRDWLRAIAETYRQGVRSYSVKSLSETTARPDLTAREVSARLSDIIDGRFAAPGPTGELQLAPTVVFHALGAALLAYLDDLAVRGFDAINGELTKWLDPIAGLDQRAEILRAAVSILVERGGPTTDDLSGVLVVGGVVEPRHFGGEARRVVPGSR